MKIALIVAGCAILTACAPIDKNYHGSVASTGSATSSVATHINAAPITISGTGETVKTVNLQEGGYTVDYTCATNYLIVSPVQSSGEDGAPIVNASGPSGASGTANFHATGRTTVHVHNTDGAWTLTFTPL
jgi:hypothetical protein